MRGHNGVNNGNLRKFTLSSGELVNYSSELTNDCLIQSPDGRTV